MKNLPNKNRNFIKEIVSLEEWDIFVWLVKSCDTKGISQFKIDYVYPKIFPQDTLKEILEYENSLNVPELLRIRKNHKENDFYNYFLSESIGSSLGFLQKWMYKSFEKDLMFIRKLKIHFCYYFECDNSDEAIKMAHSLIMNITVSRHSFGKIRSGVPDIFDIRWVHLKDSSIVRVGFHSLQKKYFFTKAILGDKVESLVQIDRLNLIERGTPQR